VMAVEAIYGLFGYFSAFKTVFIFVGLAVLFVRTRVSARRIALAMVIAGLLVAMGVVWTAIKKDYRSFANQGTGQQTVSVSPQEQLLLLPELIGNQTTDSLGDAARNLLERIGYVNFFALAIDYVPAVAPHEDGALWLGAIRHIFVPRLIDPAKPQLDDSEETTRYTGRVVSGLEAGTSIGLGYIAESYVDFGPVLMFVPILALGMLVGRAYRFLALWQPIPLEGTACAAVLVLMNASLVETSNAKILGGFVTGFLVFYVLLRFWAARVNVIRDLKRKR
jgi:hypothetical protein